MQKLGAEKGDGLKRTFRDLLLYAADCIQYYERIASLPNCNDCSNAEKGCMYLPKWGEPVRINCPHWVPGRKE